MPYKKIPNIAGFAIVVVVIGLLIFFWHWVLNCFLAAIPGLIVGLMAAFITSIFIDRSASKKFTTRGELMGVVEFSVSGSNLYWKLKNASVYWPLVVGGFCSAFFSFCLVFIQHPSDLIFREIAVVLSPLCVVGAGEGNQESFLRAFLCAKIKKLIGPSKKSFQGMEELQTLNETLNKLEKPLGIAFNRNYMMAIYETVEKHQFEFIMGTVDMSFAMETALKVARADVAQVERNQTLIPTAQKLQAQVIFLANRTENTSLKNQAAALDNRLTSKLLNFLDDENRPHLSKEILAITDEVIALRETILKSNALVEDEVVKKVNGDFDSLKSEFEKIRRTDSGAK